MWRRCSATRSRPAARPRREQGGTAPGAHGRYLSGMEQVRRAPGAASARPPARPRRSELGRRPGVSSRRVRGTPVGSRTGRPRRSVETLGSPRPMSSPGRPPRACGPRRRDPRPGCQGAPFEQGGSRPPRRDEAPPPLRNQAPPPAGTPTTTGPPGCSDHDRAMVHSGEERHGGSVSVPWTPPDRPAQPRSPTDDETAPHLHRCSSRRRPGWCGSGPLVLPGPQVLAQELHAGPRLRR